ncbi:MAG: tRNA (guanosine(37)-N1)-methyltransferase TrmD [Oscillospiraceae bacterium]|nr:tRNA (guanosine(37)-N1)-methyltransferase TrmD [Oscillospiraceae bacterium]
MRIDIATLFPDMCNLVLSESIIGRAREKNLIEINCHNIRDFSDDKHKRVDDYPYGGGKGMLIKAEPVYRCVKYICEFLKLKNKIKPRIIYLSAQGKRLTQSKIKELASLENIILICGHYEGIDQRLIDEIVDEEISIGDYVVTGGELPALILADAVCRLQPGVLSDQECFMSESHYCDGVLEYPQYTRPYEWMGRKVPEVLISGHHANIKKWQEEKSLEKTKYVKQQD